MGVICKIKERVHHQRGILCNICMLVSSAHTRQTKIQQYRFYCCELRPWLSMEAHGKKAKYCSVVLFILGIKNKLDSRNCSGHRDDVCHHLFSQAQNEPG